MNRFRSPEILLKIILVVLLVTGSGIAALPHVFSLHLTQASAALRDGSKAGAAGKIFAAAEWYPERAEYWAQSGLYAQQGGDSKLAVDALTRLSALRPLTPEEQLTLGDAHRDNRERDSALRAWEAALPLPGAYDRLVETYLAEKDYISTAHALQDQLSTAGGTAAEWYRAGLLLSAIDPEAALPYLEQAASMDTNLASPADDLHMSIRTARLFDEPAYTYAGAGQALARLGEWELAAEAFQRAVHLRPDYAEGWAYLGEARQHIHGALNGDPRTLQDLQNAYTLDPQSLSANLFMASYYRRLQDYETAIQYLYSAAEIDPENPLVWAEIGGTLSDAGDLPTALATYQKLVEMKPDDPYYWRLLAQFCLSNQVQVREVGLPAARQAVLLAPEDAVSMDLLGNAFLQLGDYLNAERMLRQALAASPSYAPAFLHLGMNELLQGNYLSGRAELEKAIVLAPNSPSAQAAERILNQYLP
jgi:tetratricopeptide (TPR) repeat protein